MSNNIDSRKQQQECMSIHQQPTLNTHTHTIRVKYCNRQHISMPPSLSTGKHCLSDPSPLSLFDINQLKWNWY